jgi:CheY-like chemotaxis protein
VALENELVAVVMQDAEERSYLETALARVGCCVVLAANVSTAVRRLPGLSRIPTTILIDTRMPPQAFRGLLRIVQQMPQLASTRVIFLRRHQGPRTSLH